MTEHNLKRWQILHDVEVEKIWPGWVGISTWKDGKKIIIKWSILPHSRITGKITRNKRDYIELGHIQTTWIDPERASVAPRCSHYHDPLTPVPEDQIHKYGVAGCQWQIVPYDKQLSLKMDMVRDSFRGQEYLLEHAPLHDIVPSPRTDNYRNKIEFSFGKYIAKASNDRKLQAKIEGKTLPKIDSSDNEFSHYHERQLGYHKKWHWDKIIDVESCVLVSDKVNELLTHMRKILKESGLPVYDQKKHDGVLRNIFFREGVHTGQILVNLVYTQDNISKEYQQAHRDWLLETLKNDTYLQQAITSFIITDNSTLSDAQRRSQSHLETLRWPGTIEEILHYQSSSWDPHNADKDLIKLKFQISPISFFQTNTYGAEKLFETAMSYAEPVGWKSTILDLYCGTWSIWLSFLKSGIGQQLIGIEIVESAVQDAYINAELNELSKESYFVAGKAEELIHTDEYLQAKLSDIGLVILDPPRSGLHPSVPEFLNQLREKTDFQLIYISCNPVTLARDLDLLVQWGWTLELLQPVDMFPHTHHVEMVSVLH